MQAQAPSKKTDKTKIAIINLSTNDDFYIMTQGQMTESKEFWRWGDDNTFPDAVALLNRRSTIHRGILNSKVGYLAGKRYIAPERNTVLLDFIKNCNGTGENLRQLTRRVLFDKKAFGNAYIEIVKDKAGKFINLFHQSALKCRISKDKRQVLLFHDWPGFSEDKKDKLKRVAIYPEFSDEQKTGYLHSMIHIKEYEPGFENYGLMGWFAGMRVGAIAYKTTKWNISRLDNSFHSSGVLVIDGDFDSQAEANDFLDTVEDQFTGEDNQGKVLAITKTKDSGAENGSKFVPIETKYDGDWTQLQDQSITELVIAHEWYRSLTSLPDNTGFDTKRILNEYQMALNTVILDEQESMLEVFRQILDEQTAIDPTDLAILNSPPVIDKPGYMKIWEARKADGMEYDETDPEQQGMIGTISATKKTDPNA